MRRTVRGARRARFLGGLEGGRVELLAPLAELAHRSVTGCQHRGNRAKLEKYIDARPTVGIEEGLQKTVHWFRENGRCWSWEHFVAGTAVLR